MERSSGVLSEIFNERMILYFTWGKYTEAVVF